MYDFVNAGLIDQGKANKVSATDGPRDHSPKSAPGESVRSTPAASRSGASASVDATGGRQREAASSPVEQAGGFSHWIVFFKQFFPESSNR